MKYIKLFENFSSVRFVRFSHSEIPEGELTPTLRRKYQEIDEDTEGVYEWTKKLVENGFPDNKVAIHFMTDDTAAREAFRASLYGKYKYEIELKDPNQKIGWTFMWPINEWFYKTNFYLGASNRMEPKCAEGKEAIAMLDSKIDHLKSVSYHDLTPEECGEMVKALLESGLIGFGTMNDLMSSKLYNKENLFVWTSNTVVVKKFNKIK
jgi:hypothetical protein